LPTNHRKRGLASSSHLLNTHPLQETNVANIPDYELTASRRGLIKHRGELIQHEGRYNALPEQPPYFRPLVGTYAEVSREAIRRNNIQSDHGFLDYVYAPEPVKAKVA
jgi:hypothetical protein